MTTAATLYKPVALGLPIPPFVAHAISVSLPTWRDNVGYMEGEERVVYSMASGYPRFVIHFSVRKLARICEQKFGVDGEWCLLYLTRKTADHCRAFLLDQSSHSGSLPLVRLERYLICPEGKQGTEADSYRASSRFAELHIVLFPADTFPLARQWWQRTGMGISSRYAEFCLSLMPEESVQHPSAIVIQPTNSHNEHDSTETTTPSIKCIGRHIPDPTKVQICCFGEADRQNSPVSSGAIAKLELRRRIAGVLVRNSPEGCLEGLYGTEQIAEMGSTPSGVKDVTENDVFLYPTGMGAIWKAYDMVTRTRPAAKSICFGFPYTDTLKILEKWGPGCYFFGQGLDSDIDELENLLEQEKSVCPSAPPALALFTEFPSNPLLRAANLPRLRALADKYDFPIIIDDTIGTFADVSVLPYADVIVTSLSKIFSGAANVMGGSLVLNPVGRHYRKLQAYMACSYEDEYYDEDAIVMELNSRDFERRISVINKNAEAVCDFLRSRSIAGSVPSSVIKDILYPKWITRDMYDHCRLRHRKSAVRDEGIDGGFGGLFSITFTTADASTAFYDTLSCYKGPSLGTNFTLACPYTILAHYTELEWAAEYGVEETLVRISVGMEEKGSLLSCLQAALRAAQATARGAAS